MSPAEALMWTFLAVGATGGIAYLVVLVMDRRRDDDPR